MRYLALVKKWRSNTLQVVDKRIHQIPLLAGTPAVCGDPVEGGERRRSAAEALSATGVPPS